MPGSRIGRYSARELADSRQGIFQIIFGSASPKQVHSGHRSAVAALKVRKEIFWKLAKYLFLLFATASSAHALDPSKQISQYAHKVWSSEGSPLYSGAEAITQGADGYLWIG